MTKPFVSVLIDTYNHERFIEKAVVSVLEQDFPAEDREILVVDDGSTDRTPEILKKFEPQVRILRKANGGQASAFNAGIPECKGEIVAFLDGDDWWAPKKLVRVAEALAEQPAVGIVGHGIVVVGRDGREQTETLLEGHQFRANTVKGGELFRRRGAFLGTSRMTIRLQVLRGIGAVPEGIRIQADEYLFTLAAVLAEAEILPEALAFYRLHDRNLFQLTNRPDPAKLRGKQKSLELLAKSLELKLEELGIEKEVRRTIVEYSEACAAQLRLSLDGGSPLETVRTEWTLFRVQHPNAQPFQKLFKLFVLTGALVAPPRTYYGARRVLAESGVYGRARERWLPKREMEHVQIDPDGSPKGESTE